MIAAYKSPQLSTFLDDMSTLVYGRKRSESIANNICVSCGKPPVFADEEQMTEFGISGLCPKCWQEMEKLGGGPE
jgi:hypothetical protein